MGKSKTLFDPGKILEWAENGLEYVFIAFENSVERQLTRIHKREKKSIDQKTLNQSLPNYDNERLEKGIPFTERLKELDELEQEESQESEIDRD